MLFFCDLIMSVVLVKFSLFTEYSLMSSFGIFISKNLLVKNYFYHNFQQGGLFLYYLHNSFRTIDLDHVQDVTLHIRVVLFKAVHLINPVCKKFKKLIAIFKKVFINIVRYVYFIFFE